MGSVDLTHVSGASSTREVPYARFYLVVIYGAGWDATTLNSAEDRATYAHAHHRGRDIVRRKCESRPDADKQRNNKYECELANRNSKVLVFM